MKKVFYKKIFTSKESGAVLMFSIILLVVMSGIGITTMNISLIEQKMTIGLHDTNRALNSAKFAVRTAKEYLKSQKNILDANYRLPHSKAIASGKILQRTTQDSSGFYFPANEQTAIDTQGYASLKKAQIKWLERNGSNPGDFDLDGKVETVTGSTRLKKIPASEVGEQPKVVIREVSLGPDKSVYSITAVGYGKNKNIQEIYTENVTLNNARVVAIFDKSVTARVVNSAADIVYTTPSGSYEWDGGKIHDFTFSNIEEGDYLQFVVTTDESAPNDDSSNGSRAVNIANATAANGYNKDHGLLGMVGHIEWKGMIFPTNPVYFNGVGYVISKHRVHGLVTHFLTNTNNPSHPSHTVSYPENTRWSSVDTSIISDKAFWISNHNWHLNKLNQVADDKLFVATWEATSRKKEVHYAPSVTYSAWRKNSFICEAGKRITMEWGSHGTNEIICLALNYTDMVANCTSSHIKHGKAPEFYKPVTHFSNINKYITGTPNYNMEEVPPSSGIFVRTGRLAGSDYSPQRYIAALSNTSYSRTSFPAGVSFFNNQFVYAFDYSYAAALGNPATFGTLNYSHMFYTCD